MNIIELLNKRYSTKEFDASKKLTKEQLDTLETILQMSASSTNAQPWHFVVASTDEGKKRIAKAAQGFFSFNEAKILNASAVVVFAAKEYINEEYLLHVLAKEEADGRFPQPEFKDQQHGGRSLFVGFHKYDYKDAQHWAEKQVYLNLGNFMLGVATMGLDSIAMEGVDFKVLDEELGLRAKGFTSCVVVPVGYHAESDFNKDLPKSRLPKHEIIDRI